MDWTTLKWGLPVLALLAMAGILTRKTFHVETVIPAPPDRVWAVPLTTSEYPEWNPVFVAVEGSYREGATVQNTVRDPTGKLLKMGAKVETMIPERELRQTGGFPGIITFDHHWQLVPVNGGTKVIQHEVDRGLYLWFWNSDWIEPSYAAVNRALSQRVTELAN